MHHPASVETWGLFEASARGPDAGNPFVDVRFAAEVRGGERPIRVDGFYDGNGIYRFRFMPDRPGAYTFRTSSNASALDGLTGRFEATPAGPRNHGPVRVRDRHHFAYADGTFYSCVGTTSYVWGLAPERRAKQTLRTLRTAGFNKMRMCIFPKHYRWNLTEPERYPFPVLARPPARDLPTDAALDGWRWDTGRFEPAYFQTLDRRVSALGALGIEADIILLHPYDRWGFSRLPPKVDERYLRYVIARLAAHRHVWWSMANEYDLFKPGKDWRRIGRLVEDIDPYGRLRSIHNCFELYDHTESWITHASIQHFDEPAWRDVLAWRARYGKPIVIDENRYEGDVPTDWGSLPARQLVHRFWLAAVAGAYNGHGESYLDRKDVIWWSHGGVLKGESAKRIRFLRRLIEDGPSRGLEPWGRPMAPWTGAKGEDYLLLYFGVHQPRGFWLRLPEGGRYRLELVDTWRMTIRPIAGTYGNGDFTKLPARPYLAVRAVRVGSASAKPRVAKARPSQNGKKKRMNP